MKTEHREDATGMSGVLTPEQAARYLSVGATTLYHLTRRCQVRSLKIGRLRRYRVQDLDAYLASLTIAGHE